MASVMEAPAHWGVRFTPTQHSKAEGAILPSNNPNPYVVLVTGAGKGLGVHITLAYAHAGATALIISSRTQSDLDSLSTQIKDINPSCQVLSVICDTQSPSAITNLASQVRSKFGHLDICVANAGIISAYLPDGSLPHSIIDDTDFARVININLTGTALTAQNFLPLLIDAPSSSPKAFIAITSLASHITDSAMTSAAYNVSKIGMNRLVECIQNDDGPKGINAYAVHPGAVVTPQTKGHSINGKIEAWDQMLSDNVGLCGGWLTWLTREKRAWLGGRYLSVNWDVGELEGMKHSLEEDAERLKMRMVL